ncbi:MAG: hypothetical protein ACR2IF_13425 [Terriglobales bacterium]
MRVLRLLVVMIAVLAPLHIFADVVIDYCDATACYTDPATLQLGQLPVPFPGSSPNLIIGSTSITVYQNQSSTVPLKTPWYLILGTPNYTGSSSIFGTISWTASAGGSGTATLDPLFHGTLNPGGEVYSSIIPTLQGPYDKSNSFTNWAGAESKLAGITATDFGLYVFDVNAVLGGKQWVTFDFGSVPQGTFAIAYGQTTTKGKNGKPLITIFDTPFTQSAFETCVNNCVPTPEPASLPLLGFALSCAAGLGAWRRAPKPQAAEDLK